MDSGKRQAIARVAPLPEQGRLRARSLEDAVANVDAALMSSGLQLAPAVRADMEERFGYSFANVRVHADEAAARAADVLAAKAFTSGEHVVFARGRYDIGSPRGERLLAHELSHVIQQSRGVSSGGPSDAKLEASAEAAAARATSGRHAVVTGGDAPSVQCDTDEELMRRRLADLDRQIREERAAVSARRDEAIASGGDKAWNAMRPGATKRLYNLMEERYVMRLRAAFPNLSFYDQVRLEGVVDANGTFHPAADVRIADWGQILGDQLQLGDLKTPSTYVKSVRGGVKRGPVVGVFKDSAGIGEQLEHEQAILDQARALGGKVLVKMRDSKTGSNVEARVDPDKIAKSRVDPYDALPDKVLGNANPRPTPVGAGTPPPAPDESPSGEGAPPTTTEAKPTETATPPAAPKTETTNTEPTGPAASETTAPAQEPTARVGMPDDFVPFVGGPSAKGEAVGGGVMLAAQAKDAVMEWLVDHVQGARESEAMQKRLRYVADIQRAHPELGAFVTSYWEVTRGNENESTHRFADISVKLGTTEKEARESNEPSLLNVDMTRELERHENWVPPLKPLSLAEEHTPFRKIAIATFAPGKAVVQGAKWKGVSGFDTHGSTTLSVPADVQPRFAILLPPAAITFVNGDMHPTVPIARKDEVTDDQYLVPAVADLDAALVFPLDTDTAILLGKGPGTHDTLNQLRGDFGMTRWIPVKDLRIIQSLDESLVRPRPPTEQEILDTHLAMLPPNAAKLLDRMRGAGGLKLTPDFVDAFGQIVPPDLSDAELKTLSKQLEPAKGRTKGQIISDLSKAVHKLPGREPVGEMVASAEDVESIKQRLDAVDWAKLPVHGVYFGDPSPMSLGPGTVTECFLHGVDDAGTKYGADVTIVVGKTQGGEMPVTVQASTDVYTREGKLYAPASNVVGRVYHVRTLSDLRSRAAARHTDVK